MKTDKFSFNHPAFTLSDGPLKYYGAQRTTVLVGSVRDRKVFQVCQIIFNKKLGSIYVQFTYFGESTGVAAAHTFERDSANQQINLAEVGFRFTSHVKYSHPPDGSAHFSQDGKVVSRVRRKSFPLDGPEGHLFEIHAFRVDGFGRLEPGEEKENRLYLPWFFNDVVPFGIAVSVEWRAKSGIKALAPPNGSIGPLVKLPKWRDGALFNPDPARSRSSRI